MRVKVRGANDKGDQEVLSLTVIGIYWPKVRYSCWYLAPEGLTAVTFRYLKMNSIVDSDNLSPSSDWEVSHQNFIAGNLLPMRLKPGRIDKRRTSLASVASTTRPSRRSTSSSRSRLSTPNDKGNETETVAGAKPPPRRRRTKLRKKTSTAITTTNPEKNLHELKCPKNHYLSHSSPQNGNSVSCDVCSLVIPTGGHGNSCRLCNFDCCDLCIRMHSRRSHTQSDLESIMSNDYRPPTPPPHHRRIHSRYPLPPTHGTNRGSTRSETASSVNDYHRHPLSPVNNHSTLTPPRKTPPRRTPPRTNKVKHEWERVRSSNGDFYWYNAKLNESTWDTPPNRSTKRAVRSPRPARDDQAYKRQRGADMTLHESDGWCRDTNMANNSDRRFYPDDSRFDVPPARGMKSYNELLRDLKRTRKLRAWEIVNE